MIDSDVACLVGAIWAAPQESPVPGREEHLGQNADQHESLPACQRQQGLNLRHQTEASKHRYSLGVMLHLIELREQSPLADLEVIKRQGDQWSLAPQGTLVAEVLALFRAIQPLD